MQEQNNMAGLRTSVCNPKTIAAAFNPVFRAGGEKWEKFSGTDWKRT